MQLDDAFAARLREAKDERGTDWRTAAQASRSSASRDASRLRTIYPKSGTVLEPTSGCRRGSLKKTKRPHGKSWDVCKRRRLAAPGRCVGGSTMFGRRRAGDPWSDPGSIFSAASPDPAGKQSNSLNSGWVQLDEPKSRP
jgi:hypothetical protein